MNIGQVFEFGSPSATNPLWLRRAKNRDAGPLACPFACSLAHSLTPELMGKWVIRCLKSTWFCPIRYGPAKNTDVSTGPLTFPFVCSLLPLTHLLVPHYSLHLRSAVLTGLLARSLTMLIPSLVGQ